jgi:hypothetical protein
MSQSNDLLNAAGALTDAVHDALLDAAYSPFQLPLQAAHNALTTEMYLIAKYSTDVDSAPAASVQGAIAACSTATGALSSAATPDDRSEAVALTFAAIEAIRNVLPAAVRAFL